MCSVVDSGAADAGAATAVAAADAVLAPATTGAVATSAVAMHTAVATDVCTKSDRAAAATDATCDPPSLTPFTCTSGFGCCCCCCMYFLVLTHAATPAAVVTTVDAMSAFDATALCTPGFSGAAANASTAVAGMLSP